MKFLFSLLLGLIIGSLVWPVLINWFVLFTREPHRPVNYKHNGRVRCGAGLDELMSDRSADA
jgi:hypothetical protein